VRSPKTETATVLQAHPRYNVATLVYAGEIAMPAEAVVRARIDKQVKADASAVLEAMGLSLSDAIRLLLVRVAKDKALPFEVKVPNAETRAAIAELEAGKGERFASVAALMADLNADD
jgi:DNA-damage-inducible protein J